MCGISGIIHRDAGKGHLAPVGLELVNMLEAMKHRGEDSCGVTVSGEEEAGDLIVRLWAGGSGPSEPLLSRAEARIAECGGVVVSRSEVSEYLRLVIAFDGDPTTLAQAMLEVEGIEIHSIGRASEVVKDVGAPAVMDHKHHVSQLMGTHGIGHLRMATESRVDISHSHPFWAYPSPDITVVHNGQAHQLPQTDAPLSGPGPPFPDPQRLRSHRRLPGRQAGSGRQPGRGPEGLHRRPGRNVHLPCLHG